MSRHHQHQWVEVDRRFTPPVRDITSVKNAQPDILERLMHGFTTIEMRCDECSFVEFISTPGDQT